MPTFVGVKYSDNQNVCIMKLFQLLSKVLDKFSDSLMSPSVR